MINTFSIAQFSCAQSLSKVTIITRTLAAITKSVAVTKTIALSTLLLLSSSLLTPHYHDVLAAEQAKFVNLGAADIDGVYDPMGAALCQILNLKRDKHKLGCWVETGNRTTENLNLISEGRLDLAIARTNIQDQAYIGLERFASYGPNTELRSIATLHTESFTVVTHVDSDIRTVDDLLGKKISIGQQGSGHRMTMEALMISKGWPSTSYIQALDLHPKAAAQALCDRQIDAYVVSVSHPSANLMQASNTCDTSIVSLSTLDIDQLIASNPHYVKISIPANMYRGNNSDVETFGMRTSLIATTALNSQQAYLLAKAISSNIDLLHKMHPAFRQVTAQTLASNTSSMPIHSGALKYYRETRLSEGPLKKSAQSW